MTRISALSVCVAIGMLSWAWPAICQQSDPAEIRVVRLQHLAADTVAEIISRLIDRKGFRVATEARTNSLIISGTKDELATVTDVLAKLDVEESGERMIVVPVPALRVRVFWLASDLGSVGEMPKDLSPVLKELESLGIGKLELAGQMMVNVSQPNSSFSVHATPELKQSYQLKFQGRIRSQEGKPLSMQASIDCSLQEPTGKPDGSVATKSLANLETVIDAPLGQYIVLGTTLTGRSNSVFVLQLLPRERAASSVRRQ
jgi:hypothetical protein